MHIDARGTSSSVSSRTICMWLVAFARARAFNYRTCAHIQTFLLPLLTQVCTLSMSNELLRQSMERMFPIISLGWEYMKAATIILHHILYHS